MTANRDLLRENELVDKCPVCGSMLHVSCDRDATLSREKDAEPKYAHTRKDRGRNCGDCGVIVTHPILDLSVYDETDQHCYQREGWSSRKTKPQGTAPDEDGLVKVLKKFAWVTSRMDDRDAEDAIQVEAFIGNTADREVFALDSLIVADWRVLREAATALTAARERVGELEERCKVAETLNDLNCRLGERLEAEQREVKIQRELAAKDRQRAERAERQLTESRKDVNDLNEVLRAAGWGQGEIDSAAEMLYESRQRHYAECDELLLSARNCFEQICADAATCYKFKGGKYVQRTIIEIDGKSAEMLRRIDAIRAASRSEGEKK